MIRRLFWRAVDGLRAELDASMLRVRKIERRFDQLVADGTPPEQAAKIVEQEAQQDDGVAWVATLPPTKRRKAG